jgi:hypothetical protein
MPHDFYGENSMNFPLENPFFRFLYWLINTPTIGGVFAILIIGMLVTTFAVVLYWVVSGAKADEVESYSYPTSSLIEH